MPHPKSSTEYANAGRSAVTGNLSMKAHASSGSDASAEHAHRRPKTNDLMRFSVAMPEDLLMDFDQLVARRGLAKNRSEVIRDLVREALVEERSSIPGTLVMGTLTIVYDHHSSDLNDKLHTIQHDFFDNIVSTMHVHVDHHTCLEVIVLRGETELIQTVSNMILGTKGVKNGKLVLASVG